MRGPFLMPDGRSLAAVLAAEARDPAGGDAVVRRGRIPRTSHGAVALERRWKRGGGGGGGGGQATTTAAASAAADPSSSSTPALLAADLDLARLGRAKARRALNDRILRALAGPLTLSSISSLYSPAPFGGGGPPSALSRVLPGGEGAAVWEAFRSVDSDRQSRALAAWEGHLAAAGRAGGRRASSAARRPADAATAAAAAATAGLRAWAGVSHRAREALKRAGASRVDAVEAPVLLWLAHARSAVAAAATALSGAEEGGTPASAPPSPPPLRIPTPDAWARALIHGLSQFHRLRLKRGRGAGGEDVSELHLASDDGGGGSGPTPPAPPPPPPLLTSEDEDGASTCPPTPRSVISPSAVPPASCGDVLAAFAAARAAVRGGGGGGPDDTTPSACLRDFLLEHAGAAPTGVAA